MNLPVSLHPLARAELNNSTDYYNEVNADLASRFLDDFDAAVQSVSGSPESYLRVTETVRRKGLEIFPFFLFYTLKSDEIRILAVAHQSRRPFYWSDRS
ncbi:MAG: type II toxin-antitoxin system RelE/ParE family toxin [Pyrinomonadaceae bacterium]